MDIDDLKQTIRQVPDFPKPGINFYDVATLFRNGEAFRVVVDRMVERFEGEGVDALVGIEARGFVLAAAMAYRLGCGLVLVRKQGKLPGETEGETYSLEYGEARIEVQREAVAPGQRIVVVDDLLATGGTAAAAARLVERLGGQVHAFAFMVELAFLGGRELLDGRDVFDLIRYD